MIIFSKNTIEYLKHRIGEKKILLPPQLLIVRKDLRGNANSQNFLDTFGNSNITAYVGFIGLAGFSNIVQGKQPDEIASFLRIFLEKIINLLANIGKGSVMVDKMIGDEVMFVLPEMEEMSNPFEILLLGQIMGGLHDLAYELAPSYKYRIGISYDKVNVFHLKGKKYSEWTIVGEPVHIAKILHGLKELAFPEPVCGAFGIALNDLSEEEVLSIIKQKMGIIAGFASSFGYRIHAKPQIFKGVGKVIWAYLFPKGETNSSF